MNRQVTLMFLDKYTKSSVIQQTTSSGTAFAQRGEASNKMLPPYDKILKIWSASNAYRNETQHRIAQNILAIQTVVNKIMTTNTNPVSQVSP